MSLLDIFVKRGHQNFRKKKHYNTSEPKDVDRDMGWFKSSVPPPLIPQEDGSMRVPGGGHSFHPVDAPHRVSRYRQEKERRRAQGARSIDDDDDDFIPPRPVLARRFPPVYVAPAHQPGRTDQRGSSRHIPQHHSHPSHHSGYTIQQGQLPQGSQRWSQQANLGQVSQHDWANSATGHPALQQSPFEQPRQPSQRTPSNQRPQHLGPAPRPGRFREGDQLPPGVVDPLATVSPNYPLGHYGMRQHVAGMTKMNPERHGKADDPMANFKVLEEMAGLEKKSRHKRRH